MEFPVKMVYKLEDGTLAMVNRVVKVLTANSDEELVALERMGWTVQQ